MSEPRNPASGQATASLGLVSRVRFTREALLRQLARETDWTPVDLGAGDDATLDRARADDPDLVLIDLPPTEACFLSEALLEIVPGTRPVVVHSGLDQDQLVGFAGAGFVGFVSCDCGYADLLRELRGVLREDSNCSPQLAGALIRSLHQSLRNEGAAEAHLAVLSTRERQVARLLEQHYSNKEIASELGIEFGTVKNHVHSVLTKLHLSNRWELLLLNREGEKRGR